MIVWVLVAFTNLEKLIAFLHFSPESNIVAKSHKATAFLGRKKEIIASRMLKIKEI